MQRADITEGTALHVIWGIQEETGETAKLAARVAVSSLS